MSQLAPLLFSPLHHSKTKRSRFSQKHKTDGLRLADVLRGYQRQFPRFADDLDDCIQRVAAQAERTRESDRQKVLKALKDWPEGLNRIELVEDTGLSEWDVRQALASLIKSNIVRETREPMPGTNPTRWRKLYVLKR